LLILVANLVVLAYGQSLLGTAPSERGREPRYLLMQNHPEAVTPGPPLETTQIIR